MDKYDKKKAPVQWRAFAPPQATRRTTSRSRPGSGVPLVPADVPPDTSQFLCGVAYNALVKDHLEDSEIGSLFNRCSVAYQHMLQSTRELAFPNPLRTSFACAILDRLLACQVLRDSSGIVQMVKADVFASLYFNTTPDLFLPCPATDLDVSLHRFKAYTLYFKEHEIAAGERDDILNEMQTKRQTSTKELVLMERIIHRWQAMMLDRLFGAWRNFVKRRRLWRMRVEDSHSSRCKRILLRSAFAAWRTSTSSSLAQQRLESAEAKCSEYVASEDGLLREYAKLVAGIERLKTEKAALQETVQQCNDDIASLKLTVEQLQGRLEHQRSTTNSWKEVAVELCRSMSRKLPSAPLLAASAHDASGSSNLLHSLSGGSSTSVEKSTSRTVNVLGDNDSGIMGFPYGHNVGVETSNADEDVPGSSQTTLLLDWVNTTRAALVKTSTARSTDVVLAQSVRSRSHFPDRVVNFDRDFADGVVLLDLVDALNAAPTPDVKRHRAELTKPERVTSVIRFSLEALCTSSAFRFPSLIDPIDVAAAKAASAMRLLVAHLISRAPQYRCPLCDCDEDNGSKYSLGSQDDNINTISAVWSRVSEAQKYHQAKRCEIQEAVDRAWCNMNSVVTRSIDAELRYILQEVMGKECVNPAGLDALRLAAHNLSDTLQSTFVLVATPNAPSISVEHCLSVIQWIKGSLKFPVRRVTADLIQSLASHPGVVDRLSWDLVVTYLALSNVSTAPKQSQQDALTSLQGEMAAITSSIQFNPEIVARHEFLSVFSSDAVETVLQAATTLLAKMWVGNLGVSPDTIAPDRFISILKASGRVFTKSFGVDDAKRVFTFVTLEPNTAMTFTEFSKAVLCICLMRDSQPWQPAAAKLKSFLSKELAPQPLTQNTKHDKTKLVRP